MNAVYRILTYVVVFVAGVVTCLSLRKENNDVKTEIQEIYVKGEEVIKEIPIAEPYVVYKTIEKEVPAVIDTAELYEAWRVNNMVNNYMLDFSDDSIGIFKVDLTVTENRIAEQPRAIIQPNTLTIKQTKTINKVKSIQGFISCGSDIHLSCSHIQTGIDFKQKYIIGVSGIRINDKYGYTVNVGFKF